MTTFYDDDLAYIHATAFGGLIEGAAPFILDQLRETKIAVRQVVDAGCGDGMMARALIDAGYKVHGIELSPAFIELARRNAPQATLVNRSVHETGLPPCQAILAIGEVLSYHHPNADAQNRLAHFIGRCADTLPRGGLLLFDIITGGKKSLSAKTWSTGADWALLVDLQEAPEKHRLTRRIQTFRRQGKRYRRSAESHHVRVFDVAAVRDLLRAHGFSVKTQGAYGACKLLPRRTAFVARKK